MSKPYNSKHVVLNLEPPRLVSIGFSIESKVLMITSLICSNVPSKSAPILSYSSLNWLNESLD